VPLTDAQAIAGRLRDWADRNGGLTSLHKRTEIPRSTISGWVRRSKNPPPNTPDVAALLDLARKERINPAYLLLGESPEIVGATQGQSDLMDELRRHLAAAIARELGVHPVRVERALPTAATLMEELRGTYAVRVKSELQHFAERKAQLMAASADRTLGAWIAAGRKALGGDLGALADLLADADGEKVPSEIAKEEQGEVELVSVAARAAVKAKKSPARQTGRPRL
jgi:hypothetical protein